jgi:hypothetical protein
MTTITREGVTGAGSGTSKRTTDSSGTPTTADKQHTMRRRILPEVSYRDAASNYKMAIVREKYLEDKLVEEHIKDIQSEILRNVDGAKHGEPLPLLRTYSLQGALIYFATTKNLATGSPLTSMEPTLGTNLS